MALEIKGFLTFLFILSASRDRGFAITSPIEGGADGEPKGNHEGSIYQRSSDSLWMEVVVQKMKKVLDRVGLFAYTNDAISESPTTYHAASYPESPIPSALQMYPAVCQIGQVLKGLP